MSASINPTLYPSLASATEMFTASVVFPTPPLPEPIATIFATPGNGCGAGGWGACPCAIKTPLLRTFSRLNVDFVRYLPRLRAALRYRFSSFGRALVSQFLLPLFAPPSGVFITPLLILSLRLQSRNRNTPPLRIHSHKR